MRCRPRVLCLRTHRGGLAWNSRLYESQIIELSRASGPGEGQQNNRKLNEPCARRQIRFNYIGTTSSQCTRMKNRILKAASIHQWSRSGIRQEGCKHSYGGVAQRSGIEEGRPQALFMSMKNDRDPERKSQRPSLCLQRSE